MTTDPDFADIAGLDAASMAAAQAAKVQLLADSGPDALAAAVVDLAARVDALEAVAASAGIQASVVGQCSNPALQAFYQQQRPIP